MEEITYKYFVAEGETVAPVIASAKADSSRDEMRIIRVFPRKTNATPDDDLVSFITNELGGTVTGIEDSQGGVD